MNYEKKVEFESISSFFYSEDLETKYITCMSENEQLRKRFLNEDDAETPANKELEDKTNRKRESVPDELDMFNSGISASKKSKGSDSLEIINLSDFEIKSTIVSLPNIFYLLTVSCIGFLNNFYIVEDW